MVTFTKKSPKNEDQHVPWGYFHLFASFACSSTIALILIWSEGLDRCVVRNVTHMWNALVLFIKGIEIPMFKSMS